MKLILLKKFVIFWLNFVGKTSLISLIMVASFVAVKYAYYDFLYYMSHRNYINLYNYMRNIGEVTEQLILKCQDQKQVYNLMLQAGIEGYNLESAKQIYETYQNNLDVNSLLLERTKANCFWLKIQETLALQKVQDVKLNQLTNSYYYLKTSFILTGCFCLGCFIGSLFLGNCEI